MNSSKVKKRYIAGGILLFLCLASFVVCKLNSRAADIIFVPLARIVSIPLKAVNRLFPIAAYEVFLILIIPLIVLLIVFTIKKTSGYTDKQYHRAVRSTAVLLAGVLLGIYLLLYGLPCLRTPVIEVMYDGNEVTGGDELYELTCYLTDMANETRPDEYDFDFERTRLELESAYGELAAQNDYIEGRPARAKKSIFSVGMSYFSITGLYVPFTAEAMVSADNPDFVIPYTMAHEMAHSMLVAREDEANFFAFLVCSQSESREIRYSAYFETLIYCINAMYANGDERLAEIWQGMDEGVVSDMLYNNEHIEGYEGTSTKVGDFLNDLHLKMAGQDGTNSYDLVVTLMLKWYQTNNR